MYRKSEDVVQVFRLHCFRKFLVAHFGKHCFAHHFLQAFFELTHSAFGGIVLDYGLHCLVADFYRTFRQVGALEDAFQEMPFGYLMLFFRQVSAQFYYFHAVKKRGRHSGERVGCGYEQDV